MNPRKQDAARAEVRALLEPVKQAVLMELGKIQAEIHGGTEAVGKMRQHQAEQSELINDILRLVKNLEARVSQLEAGQSDQATH